MDALKAAKRVLRYVDQAAARELLRGPRFGPRGHRVGVCCRVPVPFERTGVFGVPVLHSPARAAARVAGLMVCAAALVCPVCGAKISTRRTVEVARAVELHQAGGGCVGFLTLTVPHLVSDRIPELLGSFLAAVRSLKSRRWYSAAMAAAGFAGEIRSLETTHGRNGWHPHTHSLLFLGAGAGLPELRERLRDLWASSARLKGLVGADRMADFLVHGLDLVPVGSVVGEDALAVAEYVTKSAAELGYRAWGPGDELARGNVKQGRQGGRTPFAILADYAATRDQRDGALFRDYAEAFKGAHQLRWSRGLKARFGIREFSDQALAELETEPMDTLGVIEPAEWDLLTRWGSPAVVGELVEVARSGDWLEVRRFVDSTLDGYLARVAAGAPL